MLRFLATRLAQFPLILAIIYLVTFLLAWVAPGDPFSAQSERNDPERVAALKEKYNVTSSGDFLTTYPLKMLRGEFGPSFSRPGTTVNEIIKNALPVSLAVGTLAIIFATFAGVGIGTLASVRRGGVIDFASLTIALIGVSLPSFVVAATLLSGFAYNAGLFPLGGWPTSEGRGFANLDAYDSALPWLAATFDYLGYMILPAAALSLLPMAYITRLTRVSMIDVLGNDYVRTARAKGVSRIKVIFKHGLRNGLLPVLSFLGPATANVMVGSFVVEKIFQLPGLGTFFIESVQARDQTMILGTVMVYSVLLLSLNLAVDVLYSVVDPRISVGGAA
ncbi:MAG: ABC transporter permease [Planctomycetota bacterium]